LQLTKENLHEKKFNFTVCFLLFTRRRGFDSLFRWRLARRGEFRGAETQARRAHLRASDHKRHWRGWLRAGPAGRSFESKPSLHPRAWLTLVGHELGLAF